MGTQRNGTLCEESPKNRFYSDNLPKYDDAFKKYPRKNHRYLLGKEIIFESILLSNCNNFLFVQTNVSNFVRYFNPKIKFEFFKITWMHVLVFVLKQGL